ncbi:unnamed protein product [Sphenostylis stenocarpa]|uniref:Response regulatory domain-containing protein n=1 Tax=Sphenostylis stenocarpa TaxID=92480 RepID=A0AA86SEW0_9FABA|nr:unnamed protein product [Sphenostylis stenocarpa]
MANVSNNFPEGLRILAVDNDPSILEFINQMCFQCNYHVTTFSDSPLALNYVREKKNFIDLILIEVHMPNMNGYEFLKHVGMEISVPVIMMSCDNAKSVVMKAIEDGACDYWTKPLHENQFKIIWKHVAKKVWNEIKLPGIEEISSSVIEAPMTNKKQNNSNVEESNDGKLDDNYEPLPKKPRVVWTQELHSQFVNAVMQIGIEMMNIPGLTREHVASHLQVGLNMN